MIYNGNSCQITKRIDLVQSLVCIDNVVYFSHGSTQVGLIKKLQL